MFLIYLPKRGSYPRYTQLEKKHLPPGRRVAGFAQSCLQTNNKPFLFQAALRCPFETDINSGKLGSGRHFSSKGQSGIAAEQVPQLPPKAAPSAAHACSSAFKRHEVLQRGQSILFNLTKPLPLPHQNAFPQHQPALRWLLMSCVCVPSPQSKSQHCPSLRSTSVDVPRAGEG